MRKGSKVIFIILFTLIIFGIGKNQVNHSYTNATSSIKTAILTPESAVSIIKNKFHFECTNIVYQYDHDSSHDGKEFYVIHIYTNEITHSATIGWYGVDKVSGKIYDELEDEYLN